MKIITMAIVTVVIFSILKMFEANEVIGIVLFWAFLSFVEGANEGMMKATRKRMNK
jgi:5-bromo-4-chloroindolyl phosphate hydrolysis protein